MRIVDQWQSYFSSWRHSTPCKRESGNGCPSHDKNAACYEKCSTMYTYGSVLIITKCGGLSGNGYLGLSSMTLAGRQTGQSESKCARWRGNDSHTASFKTPQELRQRSARSL